MKTRSGTDNAGTSEAAVLSPPKGKAGKARRSKKGNKTKTLPVQSDGEVPGTSGQNFEVAGPSRKQSRPLDLPVSSCDDDMSESDGDQPGPSPPPRNKSRTRSRTRSCSRSSTTSGSESSR